MRKIIFLVDNKHNIDENLIIHHYDELHGFIDITMGSVSIDIYTTQLSLIDTNLFNIFEEVWVYVDGDQHQIKLGDDNNWTNKLIRPEHNLFKLVNSILLENRNNNKSVFVNEILIGDYENLAYALLFPTQPDIQERILNSELLTFEESECVDKELEKDLWKIMQFCYNIWVYQNYNRNVNVLVPYQDRLKLFGHKISKIRRPKYYLEDFEGGNTSMA